MKYTTLSFLAVASIVTSCSARGVKRQSGPVDPSTDPDCSYYDTVYSPSDNCAYLENFWGVSHADFVLWNPSVLQDCSGIKIGNSYCVEVTRKPTTTTSSTTSSPTITGTPKPSPTQDGLIASCTTFYLAASGDTCTKIVNLYGTFTLSDFYAWNPAVGSDCTGLQAKVYYCVGIPGTPTAMPTTSTTTTSTGNGIATPTPIQPGMVSNCDVFYFVQSGDGCQVIADKNGITLAQFTTWNPQVGGSSCSGLWASVYVCVSIIGHTPTTTTTTTKPPTTTTTTTSAGNGIATPTPTQPGMVPNCDAFYFVQSGDGCQAIADKNGITLTQFTTWNPQVGGSACTGLWASVYVCVSIIGHTPTTTTTTTKTTTTTVPSCTAASLPSPTQPGAICACKKWHKVVANQYCADIEKLYGITAAQFNAWNPQVGANCGTLWLGYNVCVGA
ncbi:hypothetical protein F4825DRAFT_451089 [Nemania diffusa]|nr:hypothetical protein F4825DRAFT_451089 [Nemania diffusa]